MGIVKEEDLIAWRDSHTIICPDCGDPGEAEPLTQDDFEETNIVSCDNCGQRIQ
jgi:hypothetical protein